MTNFKSGKADLHIHSSFSYDGFAKPELIVKTAAKIGIDVVAITDHDRIDGALQAQKFEKKYGVDVIVGEEILSNEGEVLGLYLKEEVKSGQTLKETIQAIRRQGGLVIIPHPFSWFPLTRPSVGLKRLYNLVKDKNLFPDGIEILNSMLQGRLSLKRNKRVNEKVFNLAPVAGSDAHIEKHIGMSVTLFPGKTKEDLKKAIIERKTKPVGDFITGMEHVEVIRKNILKMGKSAGKKLLKPYHRLKESINNRFNDL